METIEGLHETAKKFTNFAKQGGHAFNTTNWEAKQFGKQIIRVEKAFRI